MEVIKIKNFLTTKEVQENFKVTRGTVNNWRKEGMPFKTWGRMIRFEENEIIKWLDKRENKLSND